MIDLDFQVRGVEAEPFAAAPMLVFKIGIDEAGDAHTPVHAVALRCQIRVDPARRRYSPQEQAKLLELFGQPSHWSQTLRSLLWTHASAIVPAFAGSTVADLPVPCTYDFTIAMTKYFDALGDDGDVPLSLLFSGTVFHRSAGDALQAAPISWDKEATYRLPVRVWREMIDRYYPNTAWLSLRKDVFDRLRQFKLRAGHLTFEQAMEELLLQAEGQEVAG
jgi:hypothetical protein